MSENSLTPELRKQFKEFFGVLIDPYWDGLFGFDVIKFDEEFVKTPENKSMKEHISEIYSEDACKFVESLFDMIPLKDLEIRFTPDLLRDQD